jgi:small-conductance mechanosensitive channel/CRP-like cAMP-binding protein
MSFTELWGSFRDGRCGIGLSLLLGASGAVASLLLSFFVLKPMVRAFSRKDIEKVYQSRLRRTGFALMIASVALGVYVFCHAIWPPQIRGARMAFEASELLLILFTGYVLLEILLSFFGDFLPRVRGQAPLAPIIKDLVRAILLMTVALFGVKVAFPEVDIGAIMTTSAILSVVIGLALQESLSNIFAGIMLTIDRPYKPGDWIEIDGKEGKILDSNWRSTRVMTRDDDIIYVPNSTMAKSNIINLTDPTPEHLCRRKLGIEYGAAPNKVRNVLINLMNHVDGVLKDPPPDVYVVEYADSAVIYDLRFWIVDYDRRLKIEAEIMRTIWYHLKREGISIPYPIRDVYLRRAKAATQPGETVELLKKVDILQPLKDEEVAMLAEDLSSHLYGKGEVICRQGEPGSTFYIIKSGRIGVRVKKDDADVEVAQLEPGNYFGEMSLLTGDARSSSCVALEDSELLCLDRDSFAVLLQENPPVAKAMSDILAARSQATQKKLSEERGTEVRRSPEEGSKRILERIWTIFRPKK